MREPSVVRPEAARLPFRTYVALGDSMSIDDYPRLDALERGFPPDQARGLGAASLFRGMLRGAPELGGFLNLTADGTTVAGPAGPTLRNQVEALGLLRVGAFHRHRVVLPALVTITAGGNDLLGLLGEDPKRAKDRATSVFASLLGLVVGLCAMLRHPDTLILLTDVYDPTDGTGRLRAGDGEARDVSAHLPVLAHWNAMVARVAEHLAPTVRLAPAHRAFYGHGEWERGNRGYRYWTGSAIEPGMVGAQVLAELWWGEVVAARGLAGAHLPAPAGGRIGALEERLKRDGVI